MAKPKVTEREVRFARAFLKAGKFNQTNGYLLLAIIAWMRAEVGPDLKYMRGNNPFNIRRSKYASGYLQTNGNGKFAIFKDLATAAKATVAFLIDNRKFGNYGPILAAAKRGGQTAGQAVDFLLAVAMSKWSAGHYGWKPATQGHYVTRELPNGTTQTTWVPGKPERMPSLIKIWEGLTGTKIPDAWFIDKTTQQKTVVKKAPPRQPRSFQRPLIRAPFIQPYASRSFYEARPHGFAFILGNEDVQPTGE